MPLPSRAEPGDATIRRRFKAFFRIKAECVPVKAFADHSNTVKPRKRLVKICNSPEKSPPVHVCVNDMTSGLSGWAGNFHQENQGTGCLVTLSRACAAGLGPFLQKQRLHNEPGVAMAKLAACCDRQGRQFAETAPGIRPRPSRMARTAPGVEAVSEQECDKTPEFLAGKTKGEIKIKCKSIKNIVTNRSDSQ